MAIRIKHGEWIIEVDSGNELQEVMPILASLDTKEQSKTNPKKSLEGMVRPRTPSDRNLSQLFMSFSNTRKAELLQALKDTPDGMTDENLRTKIHLENNNALAGVLGAISKNALKVGLKPSYIMTKSEQKGTDGKRVYVYKLTKEMAEAMP